MRRILPILLCLTLLATVASAQPSVAPNVKGETVPTWVFYWVLGIGTIVLGGAGLIIRHLYAKSSVLTEEERKWLQDVHSVVDVKDANQIPLVYSPRSLISEFQKIEGNLKEVLRLVDRLVEQGDGTVIDLREQLRARLELHDKQQNRMLRLAVRVQRAVEALAGLSAPDIEDEFDDDEEDA